MATDWNKVGKEAAAKVDTDLAAGLEKLGKRDITGLFPDPADKAKVEALQKKINATSSYNERAAAFKAVAATLGADALKMLKGAMLALLICLAFAPAARAQVVEPPAPSTNLFNFGDFFKSIRIGYAIDQHGAESSIFYTSILTYHTEANIDLVSFNIGYEGVLKRPTTMIGVRLDNIVPLMVSGTWGKKYIKTANLPSFEAGPFISFWPKSSENLWDLEVSYGLAAALGF